MKTFKRVITEEKPRLVISYDESPLSPREDTNLGYFLTCENRYESPDGNNAPELQAIVKETSEEAIGTENHIELITKRINSEAGDTVIKIFPVYRYEHGGVAYHIGKAGGFDYSNCGFYIITKKSQADVGVKEEDFEKYAEEELNTYTKYANGEVYRYVLYDEKGEEVDGCCGFYEVEDVKAHLPEEWKDEDMDEYLVR